MAFRKSKLARALRRLAVWRFFLVLDYRPVKDHDIIESIKKCQGVQILEYLPPLQEEDIL